jgi:integrase
MACLSRDKATGSTRILFVATDGKRKTIRFGKLTQKQADTVKIYMENLIAASVSGSSMRNTTAEWLADLPGVIRKRIENAGLIEPMEQQECLTVQQWFDQYLDSRSDIKKATRTVFNQACKKFTGHVGKSKRLDEITAWDAEAFRSELKSRGLSEAYVRRTCRSIKQFFAAAIRKKLLIENPFAEIKCGNFTNKTRYHFMSREESEQVLANCPDNEWRLIFSLARFGGLRVPSELLTLRWADVDWERERLTIHAVKTEHHSDGGVRQLPMFQEIKPYLLKQFDKAKPGEEFVITQHRQTNINLRTQLGRIIKRAGLVQWPKMFQNLRSSRETELAQMFPLHVVTAWLGNTPRVAQEHYLQLRDSDFAKAIAGQFEEPKKAAHNPAQYTSEMDGIGRNTETGKFLKASETTEYGLIRKNPNPCNKQELGIMGDTGLEPVTCCL